MSIQPSLQSTPLFEEHRKLSARMIDYAGWNLPVQYAGIQAEHLAVRQSAGLFDVSHMGEILISGPAAPAFLNYLLTRDLRQMKPGRAYYSPMCAEDGGTVDDLIVYPLQPDRLLLVVNAANTARDLVHIQNLAGSWNDSHSRPVQPVKTVQPVQPGQPGSSSGSGTGAGSGHDSAAAAGAITVSVTVSDLSSAYAQLSLQGPSAAEILGKLAWLAAEAADSPDASALDGFPSLLKAAGLRPYHFIWQENRLDAAAAGCLISRTGYTGEEGYEIYLAPEKAPVIWQQLLDLGAVPAGLGARDSLRLEAGMPLYGHELAPDITPLEAGLQRFVDLDKPAPGFVGQAALRQSLGLDRKSGALLPPRRLIGLRSLGRAIPRAGYPVRLGDRQIGHVTSGTFSPSLEVGIAMALVDTAADLELEPVSVLIRNKIEAFAVCPLPFYQRAT